MDGSYREAIALMVRVTPMARSDLPNQVDYCLKVSSTGGRSHDVDIIHLDHQKIQERVRRVVLQVLPVGLRPGPTAPL